MKFYIRVRDLYVVLVIYYFFSSILYEPQIPPPIELDSIYETLQGRAQIFHF